MQSFKRYHPLVNLLYFVLVISFSLIFIHPVCLAISHTCALFYYVRLNGRKALRFTLFYLLPSMVFAALLNPAFHHEGATILTYLPGGNPLTLESILYGIVAAVMIASVIVWFSCYNAVMTSDKFIYLFGRAIPALSLILSMILRFIPLFQKQSRIVANAQKCMGRDVSEGSLIHRAKNGLAILSVMTTWVLENAIETADSMKSRGYGLPGRTAFSIFRFDRRDAIALTAMLLCGLYLWIGKWMGGLYFRYFPSIRGTHTAPYSVSLFLIYFILCLIPMIIELWEDYKWKAIKSNI